MRKFPHDINYHICKSIIDYCDGDSLSNMLAVNKLIREYILLQLFQVNRLDDIKTPPEIIPFIFLMINKFEKIQSASQLTMTIQLILH